MIITNKTGLPDMLQRAVSKEYTYRDKRYSITSLLEPSRIIALKRRYNNQIKQDITDCIFMLLGTKTHFELENIELKENEFVEDHLEYTFENGYTLSGIIDHYDDEYLDDYKTCKAFALIYKSDYEKWKKQLQMGAYLAYKKDGKWRKKGRIIALIKDWNRLESQTKSGYPKFACQVVKFNLGTPEQVEKMILKLFDNVIKLEQMTDDELPLCTADERYNKGTTWAVKKKKNKRASKVHCSEEEAKKHLENLEKDYPGQYEIEKREGENTRCEFYCSVNRFCDFWRKHYGENYMKGEEECINVKSVEK